MILDILPVNLINLPYFLNGFPFHQQNGYEQGIEAEEQSQLIQ